MIASLSSLLKSLAAQIIIGMILGIILGLCYPGTFTTFAAFGTLLIQMIKAVAVPLVFVSVLDALISTRISWIAGRRLLLITLINGLCAAGIALTLTNLIQPGRHLDFRQKEIELAVDQQHIPTIRKMNPLEVLTGHIPSSFVQPFMENDIIGVVLTALLLGVAIRQLLLTDAWRESSWVSQLPQIPRFGIGIFERILRWLVRLTPLAVFGVTAKTVGEHGLAPFQALSLYAGIGFCGFLVQALVVYQCWIYLYAGLSLREFWRQAREALVYAAGTNSSLATLPLTLASLDRLSVSRASSRLGACIGTNLNNDGIILYEAMAVLFVAQAYGIELSLSQQLSAIALALVAAIGVAGVPEAGIISLSLVLSTVNLPLEILPLLLTVDWLIARGRSVTNVLADMTVSIILDARERKTGVT